jgi:hypothetical protein
MRMRTAEPKRQLFLINLCHSSDLILQVQANMDRVLKKMEERSAQYTKDIHQVTSPFSDPKSAVCVVLINPLAPLYMLHIAMA